MKRVLQRHSAWLMSLLMGYALQTSGQEVVVTGTTIEITVTTPGEFNSSYADADTWQAVCPSDVVRLKVNGPVNRADFTCIKEKLSETLGELDLAGATAYELGFPTHEFAKYEGVVDKGNPLLRYIALPDGITQLTDYFFLNCANLGGVKLPEGLTEIGLAAFVGCTSLTTLTLPESLTHIYPRFGNTGLTEIHLRGTTVPYEYEPQYADNITLYVPVGYLSVFQESRFGQGWKEIKEETATLASLADADWAVLQLLYTSTQGANWTRSWQMGATKEETHPLLGAIIDDDRLVMLNLPDNNLQGALPASLFAMPALKKVNLSGNQLTGDLTTLFADVTTNNVLKTLDLGHNQLTGDIAAITEKLTALTTLNVNNNRIAYCSSLPPESIKKLNFGGQDLTEYLLDDEGRPIALSTLYNMSESDEESTELLPSIMFLYLASSGNFYASDTEFGLCDNWDNRTWQILVRWRYAGYHRCYFNGYSTSENGWYRGPANAILEAFGRADTRNREDCHRFQVTLDSPAGDANFDGSVDLSDMQTILNVALNAHRLASYDPFNLTAANLITTDDSINVLDVVACINLLLDQGIIPNFARASKPRKAQLSGDDAEASLTIDSQGQLVLNSAAEVAALELELSDSDVEWASAMRPFSHASRGGHHIFYSLFDDKLPVGTTVLATTTAGIKAAVAVDKDGRRIALDISQGITDGIGDNNRETINNKRCGYDLMGRQIMDGQLKAGVYVRDGKKIIIK